MKVRWVILGIWIFIILSPGCSKRIHPSLPERTTFDTYMAELNSIRSIKFVFSIRINKEGNVLKDSELTTANASMQIEGENVDLRVYSMGFLISEIKFSNGNISTEGKRISDENAFLLVDALRSCLMWWDLKEMEKEEEQGLTVIRNSWRKVFLDKNYIPSLQEIVLPEIKSVRISYEKPEFYPSEYFQAKGLWYPSMITVKLRENEVTLNIKKITIIQN